MQPIVHGLEQEFGDRVDFVTVDVDDPASEEMKRKLGYRFQPHFFLLNAEGEVVADWLGMVPEAVLRGALESVLAGG
jgi:thioredoxin-like negative regulator of GroEL